MKETIVCPNCLKKVEVKVIGLLKEMMIEAFILDKEGNYFSPRKKITVNEEKIKSHVHYLLSTWADKVIVYDLEGKKLEEYWK